MRILGFDVSSSTIGWAVLDFDKKIKLIDYGYIKPEPTEEHIFLDLKNLREKTLPEISDILIKFRPDQICIEDIIQHMPGGSSAATIIKLALYNRSVGMLAFEYSGQPPELYNVMSIRHGLKLTKELPKKEKIPELVEKILKVTLKREFSKKGKLKTENYDIADAIAVALYGALKFSNKLEAHKKKRK